jgi:hypothetical protein
MFSKACLPFAARAIRAKRWSSASPASFRRRDARVLIFHVQHDGGPGHILVVKI